jgi:GT2 family glycosyltransferase
LTGTDETIAVVVVTYNSERLLPDLIASLGSGLDGLAWHLTVADNASSDRSVDAVRRLRPEATVVAMGRNAGYAAGVNAAVAAAPPHTAILALNPDVRLQPGCGRALLAVLRRPGVGIAVPRQTKGDGSAILVLRREPTVMRAWGDALLGAHRAGRYRRLGELMTGAHHYTVETTADWAVGSAMLVSRECWDRLGGWDESFFLYSEETDFALRARDAGLVTCLAPAARAVHLEGESKTSPGLWALLMLNRVRLHRRRHGLLATGAYWSALVVREASRAALGRRTSARAARALLSRAALRADPSPELVASLNAGRRAPVSSGR